MVNNIGLRMTREIELAMTMTPPHENIVPTTIIESINDFPTSIFEAMASSMKKTDQCIAVIIHMDSASAPQIAILPAGKVRLKK